MAKNIYVCGKTTPHEINLKCKEHPFAVDEYFVIQDDFNNNPLCKVHTSEIIYENDKPVYMAIAKVESNARYPIALGARANTPTFEQIRPFIMKTLPANGFVLGEVIGTEVSDIPSEYKSLAAMYDNGIYEQASIPFVFNYKKMIESPHIGLFGGSGSGKTVAMKVLIEELMKQNMPSIVFDPHFEMNFAENNKIIPDKYKHDFNPMCETFVVGKNNFGIDFSEITTRELSMILSRVKELTGLMETLLTTLHHKGMTLLELNTLLNDLITVYSKLDSRQPLDEQEQQLYNHYAAKIPSFSSLIGISSRLNDQDTLKVFGGNIHALQRALLDQKTCIIRGTERDVEIIAPYIIEKMYLLRRSFIDAREWGTIDAEPFPPFFICMDEAHIYCPKDKPSLTKNIMRTIAQEGRKYGVFEILGTQRPALLDETIVAQISTKFIFRINVAEDIKSIQKETDLNAAEIKRLVYLNSGECYVSSPILGRTVCVKMRYGITVAKTSTNPFDEIKSKPSLSNVDTCILSLLPFNDLNFVKIIQEIAKKTGETLTVPEMNKKLSDMAVRGLIKIETSFMGKSYSKK